MHVNNRDTGRRAPHKDDGASRNFSKPRHDNNKSGNDSGGGEREEGEEVGLVVAAKRASATVRRANAAPRWTSVENTRARAALMRARAPYSATVPSRSATMVKSCKGVNSKRAIVCMWCGRERKRKGLCGVCVGGCKTKETRG